MTLKKIAFGLAATLIVIFLLLLTQRALTTGKLVVSTGTNSAVITAIQNG